VHSGDIIKPSLLGGQSPAGTLAGLCFCKVSRSKQLTPNRSAHEQYEREQNNITSQNKQKHFTLGHDSLTPLPADACT
jgi:hypothetical protein